MTMRYQDTRKSIMHNTFYPHTCLYTSLTIFCLSQTSGVSVLLDFRIPANLLSEDLPGVLYHKNLR